MVVFTFGPRHSSVVFLSILSDLFLSLDLSLVGGIGVRCELATRVSSLCLLARCLMFRFGEGVQECDASPASRVSLLYPFVVLFGL